MEVTYSAGSKKELLQHNNKHISTSSGGVVETSNNNTSTFFSLAPNTALDLPFPKSFTRDLGLYSCSATPSPTPSLSPTPSPSLSQEIIMIRYRECQKNHAAHLGSHVVDGCGEFMPAGNDGTPQSFRCAACDCHRNFHRREVDGETTSTPTTAAPPPSLLLNHSTAAAAAASAATTTPAGNCFISFNKQPPRKLTPSVPGRRTNCHNNNNNSNDKGNFGRHAAVMMAFGGGGGTAAESSSEDLNGYRAVEMGGGQVMMEQYSSGSKKRYRTKFTQEQKDKMAEFAEKIEWKMQKENEERVQQLCREVGINRQVFKVWMHNNKQTLKRKELP